MVGHNSCTTNTVQYNTFEEGNPSTWIVTILLKVFQQSGWSILCQLGHMTHKEKCNIFRKVKDFSKLLDQCCGVNDATSLIEEWH